MDELGSGRHALNRADHDNHATTTTAVTMSPVPLPPMIDADGAPRTSATLPVVVTALCAAAVGGLIAVNPTMSMIVSVLAVGVVAVVLILVWAHRLDNRVRADRETLGQRAELLRTAAVRAGTDCEIAQRAARDLHATNETLRGNNGALLAAWDGYHQQLSAMLATFPLAPNSDAADNGRDPVAAMLEQLRTTLTTNNRPATPEIGRAHV